MASPSTDTELTNSALDQGSHILSLDLDLDPDDDTNAFNASEYPRGSFEYDVESGKFPFLWDSQADMLEWLRREEERDSVEIKRNTVHRPRSARVALKWKEETVYVCSRGHSGGKSLYKKKTNRKEQESKKAVNMARLIVKSYPGTPKMCGRYSLPQASLSHLSLHQILMAAQSGTLLYASQYM
ncbi:hypothetical protein K474DRAFT_1772180 [Panus rudis PR-1116 ss-1]|nr:hypothetical protein K474DRAFT_1772180 [Panus rudis PR-1116 ss-1]